MEAKYDYVYEALQLAEFANLTPNEVTHFRAKNPAFLPKEVWDTPGVSLEQDKAPTPETLWEIFQEKLQDAWNLAFPPEHSIDLITDLVRFSQMTHHFDRVTRALEQGVTPPTSAPEPESWPYQRAIMWMSMNSWKAAKCECGKRFVKDIPARKFCSEKCFKEGRKLTKSAWWRANSKELRRAQQRASGKQPKKG